MIRFFEKLYRTPKERSVIGDRPSVIVKSVLFISLLSVTAALSFPVLVREIRVWYKAGPQVFIPPHEWKVLYVDDFNQCEGKIPPPQCPANPANSLLWDSPLSRDMPAHRERVRSSEGPKFWIGARIRSDLLDEASKLHANHFILGHINGDHRVYVDGELIIEGRNTQSEAIVMPLAYGRLGQEEPIHIAVSIIPTRGKAYPDYLNSPRGEGFAKGIDAHAYRLFDFYWDISEPVLLATVYYILAIMLFSLWISSPAKQEYAYMALWILLFAIRHTLNINPVSKTAGPAVDYTLRLMFEWSEGTLALFSGLSFARARRSWFRFGMPVIFLGGLLLPLAVPNPMHRLFWAQRVTSYYVVPVIILGALACFSQALTLIRGQNECARPTDRITRLLMFGALLLLLAATQIFRSAGAATPGYSIMHRVAPLAIVLFLSLIIFSDYRRSKRLLSFQKEELMRLKGQVALVAMASQVSHDIRSPLAALLSISHHATGLDEHTRVELRAAINRIRDIANHLLDYRKTEVSKAAPEERKSRGAEGALLVSNELRSTEHVWAIVDSLISQKRLQYRDRPGLAIEFDPSPGALGAFSDIQPTELSSLLSNFINNSVEAVQGAGRVEVSILADGKKVTIQVTDNGKGIPLRVLEKLGHESISHGKTGTESGSGLGVLHAKMAIESWRGSLSIESVLNQGTTVRATLPLAEPPAWFACRIEISSPATVVVLDDDGDIHRVWDHRFRMAAEDLGQREVEVLHFHSGEQLLKWYQSGPGLDRCVLYLFDYELIGSKLAGLDVIEMLGVGRNALLVTSHIDSQSIRQRCIKSGCRIIPKALAPLVPIEITVASKVG